MSASDESLHLTATELRMATFRLARRLRCARAIDAMSDAQLAVLSTLRMYGRRTITSLAERERVTAPSMTSMINGLEEQGFVTRTPDDEDRRRVQVDITDAGVEIVAETIQRRDELLFDAMRELEFTEDELKILHDASVLMRRVAER
ncbi:MULTISPECIES: MarR family winged helix-turn-helix transcriptional regulator [Microbacterium]|uniref:MarR family winged helix-turn-helix transcriptional regulator n=2 Tax=Actinomycetota TaxID=201174 RepID=UPI000CFDE5E7|nr:MULTISPECIES: MarR family transcriptional regulator [unclassified Microbacterium]PRB09374.1 MarR family transcriptional regulator [Microbacterium sp. MYb72]